MMVLEQAQRETKENHVHVNCTIDWVNNIDSMLHPHSGRNKYKVQLETFDEGDIHKGLMPAFFAANTPLKAQAVAHVQVLI